MDLMWVALPMVGCAVMMVLMMRMMGMGGDKKQDPPAEQPADDRRAALEAEAQELRSKLAEREPGSA